MNAPVAAPNKNTDVEQINKEKIVRYLDTFGLVDQLSELEKEQFVEIACAYQLNPFKREIYCVPYAWTDKNTGKKNRKLSIITGYEAFLKRAERTQQLNGWNVQTTGKSTDGTLRARITIYRKDWGPSL